MNDRYLYRAKRMDNGEWVEGFYFCMEPTDGRHTHHFIIPLGASLEKGTPIEDIQVEVDPSTICKCTGLKDKNGNLIFEHDILNLSMSGKVEVEFNDGVWGSDFGDGCILPMRNSLFGEGGVVIGNIFDNQELLEVGK